MEPESKMSSLTVLTQIETNEQWFLGDRIGEGAFSNVYLLTKQNDKTVLIGKIVNKKNQKASEFIKKEIEIHKNLKHDNIVEFITSFETINHYIIVQSYYEGGNLNNLLRSNINKKLQEYECQGLFHQILTGLKYLKDQNIVHRDIKPANIILKVNQEKARQSIEDDLDIFIYDVRIGDFGFAIHYLDNDCIKEIGTPNFIPPELINCDNESDDNFKIDIWSAGTTFYTCLVGIPPFQTESVKTTYNRILNCIWNFPEKPFLTAKVKSMVYLMIQLEPNDRSSVEELLTNSFFK